MLVARRRKMAAMGLALLLDQGCTAPPNAARSASYCWIVITIVEPWRAPGVISYLFHSGTPEFPETLVPRPAQPRAVESP
jgi:hypothetical protein